MRDTWKHERAPEVAGRHNADANEPSRGRSWLWTLGAILVLILLYFIFAD